MSFHPANLRTCGPALVAALLVVLAGCTDSPGATGVMGEAAGTPSSASDDPLAGAPALGTCYEMTRSEAEAVTHENPGVSCSAPHTSMTYYVGRFPTDSLIVDNDRALRDCRQNLARGVGLAPRQVKSSILTWIWFQPSTAQWSAGARWFRCDVVAKLGDGSFKPLPPGDPPYFSDGVPDEYFRCMRERGRIAVPVTCDKPHGYRWAGTFEGTGRSLPSRAELMEQAERRCDDIAGTPTWWVTWPSRELWAAGDRELACYRQTRS